MHNFKPGDLALLINVGAANNMKTVEVLEYLGRPESYPFCGDIATNKDRDEFYLVRSVNEAIVLRPGAQVAFQTTSVWEVPVSPRKLMPLRGDEQTAPAKREELTV